MLRPNLPIFKRIQGRTPKIYLDKNEQAIVAKITKQGKFCLVHPFGSHKERELLPIEGYPPLIDKLIDKYKYNVVVVGATHKRVFAPDFEQKTCTKKEGFCYEREGLYNFVNKTSVRMAVKLARSAPLYMGTWSAFYCAAANCAQGPIVFTNKNLEGNIDKVNKVRFGDRPYHKIYTTTTNYRYIMKQFDELMRSL
jgi:hypothetical protein